MARCLMFEKNIPKALWAEAVNTAAYLQNKLPTKALAHKTPFGAWFGFKPSLAHLRTFGCLCYAQVPAAKRSKLDERSQAGILVGYSLIKKGYRVLHPSTNKVLNVLVTTSEEIITGQIESDAEGPEMDYDDVPVRGTRSLAKVYERAQVAIKNKTWELVEKPSNRKVIGVKWVYRAKLNADGSPNKLKARLVVKGFSQRYGVDYIETFAPVARLDTIRLLVALAAQMNWKIHQFDVKSAFLNGYLEQEIYVNQPQGFQVTGKEDMVYKLNKALYGLKQAPRAWYIRIDGYLISLGFNRSISEPTLYVQRKGLQTQLIVSLYIDDLLVTRGDEATLADFKTKMKQMFEMSDLGLMTYFLGIEVSQTQKGICLS
ncbi:Retrovirus-related Pol polyprotein from transposon TNT 1-94 [Gossypium australe]|uniref:Retrovirus-related Pol polyprotein from transposon TNT 1-94 n=1 Tax=Gossypium australe TaxID=47621 RepID=A0A5B6VU10_9ROSI|nr:Retrovirus-related Pol polyprotein from transposon TNT 1-94 [Gossypium australe]